jgi:hypothetical protein
MACPGSVRLSAGIPGRSSRYADEGTAAHQLAERCLTNGIMAAADCIGEVERVRGTDWPVTEEMAEAVQVSLDTVRGAFEHDTDEDLIAEWGAKKLGLPLAGALV